MRRPRTAQHDVVLLVKEVGRVARVDAHGAEPFVRPQDGAGPLPDAAELALAGEGAAVGGYGNGVPVEEAGVGVAEIGEEGRGGGCRWGSFLDAVVDKVTVTSVISL